MEFGELGITIDSIAGAVFYRYPRELSMVCCYKHSLLRSYAISCICIL